jgi:hypothetical protein
MPTRGRDRSHRRSTLHRVIYRIDDNGRRVELVAIEYRSEV